MKSRDTETNTHPQMASSLMVLQAAFLESVERNLEMQAVRDRVIQDNLKRRDLTMAEGIHLSKLASAELEKILKKLRTPTQALPSPLEAPPL